MPEPELAALMAASRAPQAAAEAIVRLALEAGTRDNVTAVVCDVADGAEASVRAKAWFYGAAATNDSARTLETA